ncbi:hypothetical protein H9Q74_000029 [Fusarium xylarioides]|nr:hypothetical protein H9Q71_000131 [Fusarium xylarioides]KAG5829876.1 hypothetical protein H9Q74_000029 [Fusarium xylarioides]
MDPWVVNSISIRTVTENQTSDSLYANGLMQVPVHVLIKAKYKNKSERYHLKPQDLKLVRLFDFVDKEKEMPQGWTYEHEPNHYYHSLSSLVVDSTGAASAVQSGSYDNEPDVKTFWVSSTEVETREIAASITPPGEKMSSTNDDKNHSHVILHGKIPIRYTTDDIIIKKDEVLNGQYKLEWTGQFGLIWHESWPKYWQTNHYVTLRSGMPLKKVELHDHNPDGNYKDPKYKGLANTFAYWASDNHNMRIYYIWEYGDETSKDVGITRDVTIWNAGLQVPRKAHAEKTIRVNQKPNSVCMTVMYYSCNDALWGNQWYNDKAGFKIYDAFGNTGRFKVTFEMDRVIVRDENVE